MTDDPRSSNTSTDSPADSTARNDPPSRSSTEDREVFELLSTILLALAAVATAWAGFQSAKWSGVQATNFSQAGAARTESVRFSTLAGQEAQVDVTTFLSWLDKVIADIDSGLIAEPTSASAYEPTPGTLSGFVFARFREEFRPAVDAWLATDPFQNANAPATPFDLDEYVLANTTEADELRQLANQKAKDAATANQNSDNYVVSAVLFATSLFFAALAGKLKRERYQTVSLALAALVFAGTLVYILSLPVEV